MVREHITVFGAVEPKTGDFVYTTVHPPPKEKKKRGRPKKGTRKKKVKKLKKGEASRRMNEFMQKLADTYPNDRIVLVCDNAGWHKSQYIKIPDRVTLTYIPAYTPEMMPMEQIWRELRTSGFGNKYFNNLQEVDENIHTTITSIALETILSITQRDWILKCS